MVHTCSRGLCVIFPSITITPVVGRFVVLRPKDHPVIHSQGQPIAPPVTNPTTIFCRLHLPDFPLGVVAYAESIDVEAVKIEGE